MLETVTSTIEDKTADHIAWSHSRDDIVEGVEVLFSAVKKQEEAEKNLLDDVWEFIKTTAEIAGEEYTLPIEIGAALAFAPFAAIGAGYADAAEEIKRKKASLAFTEGLALGVMAETPDNVRAYFWQEMLDPNPAFPESEKLAQYYYNGGLALGYRQGKEIGAKGFAAVFWADIKQHIPADKMPLGDPDNDNWGRNEWVDYYITVATAFYRGHVSE